MSVKETKQNKSIEIIVNQSGTHKKVAEIPSVGGLIIGSNSTAANNVKLHRSGNTEIQFVPGDDTTAEGSTSTNSIRVYFKDMVLGPSSQRYTLGVGLDNYLRLNPGNADITSNNFVMDNTGKIGIGGIPDAKLSLQVPGATGFHAIRSIKNNSGATRITEIYDADNIKYFIGNRSSVPLLAILESSGNFGYGLGLYSPTSSFQISPQQYATGTASQSGTTVTGVGTTFTSSMVGSTITYANGVTSGIITAFTDATHLTVTTSQTVISQAFSINYNTFHINSVGDLVLKAKGGAQPLTVWGRQSDDFTWGPIAYEHTGATIIGGIAWSPTSMGIYTGSIPTVALTINSSQIVTLANALPIGSGGTGQTTANAAFNALSPMTTGGDLIYGAASGVATRLANGSSGQVLTSAGGTSAPTWSRAPSVYTYIVGSVAQVSQNLATHSDLSLAISAALTGNTICVLSGYTYSGNISINKQISIFGQGYNSYITGNLDFIAGANECLVKGLRIGGNISFAVGTTANYLMESWQPNANTIAQSGTDNIYQVLGI